MVTEIKKNSKTGHYKVSFKPSFSAKDAVLIVGSFNNWSQENDKAYVVSPAKTGKAFKATVVELPAGTYEYKYYNPTADSWQTDKKAPLSGPDEMANNVLVLNF